MYPAERFVKGIVFPLKTKRCAKVEFRMNYRGRSYWEDHQAISLVNLLSKHKWQWLFWYGSFKGFKFCGMRSDRPTDNSVTPSFCSEGCGQVPLMWSCKIYRSKQGLELRMLSDNDNSFIWSCQNAAPEKGPVSSLLPSQWAFLYLFFKSCMYSCGMLPSRPSLSTVETILFSYRGLTIGKLSQFEENLKSSLCMRHKEQKRLHKALQPLSCNKSIMSIP